MAAVLAVDVWPSLGSPASLLHPVLLGSGTECGLWGCLHLLSRAQLRCPETSLGHGEDCWKEEQLGLGGETGLRSTWPPTSFQSIPFHSGKSALATSPAGGGGTNTGQERAPPDGLGNISTASWPSVLSSPLQPPRPQHAGWDCSVWEARRAPGTQPSRPYRGDPDQVLSLLKVKTRRLKTSLTLAVSSPQQDVEGLRGAGIEDPAPAVQLEYHPRPACDPIAKMGADGAQGAPKGVHPPHLHTRGCPTPGLPPHPALCVEGRVSYGKEPVYECTWSFRSLFLGLNFLICTMGK